MCVCVFVAICQPCDDEATCPPTHTHFKYAVIDNDANLKLVMRPPPPSLALSLTSADKQNYPRISKDGLQLPYRARRRLIQLQNAKIHCRPQ